MEYFDVYMLHWLNAKHYRIAEEQKEFDFLKEIKSKGLAKKIGFSFHDSPELLNTILTAHPETDVVLMQINYLDWDSAAVQFRKCYETAVKHGKAVENGINYFDMAGGHASIYPAYGKALADCRKNVLLQVYFGADYTSGEYGWDLSLDAVKKSVDRQLKNLQTDYIDFGFMHCLDEENDLNTYLANGVLDYIKEHYLTLEKTASDCIGCGHCDVRCPFTVAQSARMQEIKEYFGK